MNSHAQPGRRATLALAGLLALASTIVVLAVSGEGEGHAAGHSHATAAATGKQVAFRDDMRKVAGIEIASLDIVVTSMRAAARKK